MKKKPPRRDMVARTSLFFAARITATTSRMNDEMKALELPKAGLDPAPKMNAAAAAAAGARLGKAERRTFSFTLGS
jgi:hypothetical protein